jgi:hypothetical protein
MLRWFYVAMHLLLEASAARRDARIRFLKAEVEILRRKLGGNRVIPSPADRARLLAIGQELGHKVADIIGMNTANHIAASAPDHSISCEVMLSRAAARQTGTGAQVYSIGGATVRHQQFNLQGRCNLVDFEAEATRHDRLRGEVP